MPPRNLPTDLPQDIDTNVSPQQPVPMKQNPWVIPLSIILAGIFIGGGIYFSSGRTTLPASTQASNVIETITVNPVTASDHILGNPNAQVTIIEFADTECPYCKVFQDTMHRIIDDYGKTGQVDWVYRHFPIAALHSRAPKEAEATECVNELGGSSKFWAYLDSIFATTNSNNTLDPSELPTLAQAQNIDVSKFNTCLSSGKYETLVTEDSQDATRAGAQGTPYSVLINNKTGEKVAIDGAQSYDVLKSVIDAALGNGAESADQIQQMTGESQSNQVPTSGY